MKAFPKITNDHQPIFFEGKFAGYEGEQNGMDLRDYFAAKAMQAYVTELTHQEADYVCGAVAEMAYFMADAMMETRNVTK